MSALERTAAERIIARADELGVHVPEELRKVMDTFDACGMSSAHHARTWRELHPGDPWPEEALICCAGAAMHDESRCTCWEPVWDEHGATQATPRPGPVPVARTRCGDCAYRPDSPERAETYTEEALLGLAAEETPFFCHRGMRRPVAYEHPVLGRVSASSDDWQPPILDGCAYQLNGWPAYLCAGWDQERRKADREANR